ncbi:MAG: hypothetical protein ABFD63_01210 [Smithella sp.]
MKVQYQLVDVETKKAILVGDEFQVVDYINRFFRHEAHLCWREAAILFGDPLAQINPVGILGESPIAAARKTILKESL